MKLLLIIVSCLIMGCATIPKTIPPCNELTQGVEDGYGNGCQCFHTASVDTLCYYVPLPVERKGR
jgi:Na+-transporting NADH:ubiquinone oxidoreductase subunit NqrD